MVRFRVLISGRVQGVFFRDSCRRVAEQHGVAGWVRNLPDGRVEAVFEGLAEQHGVAGWVRNLPDGRVEAVFEGSPDGVCHLVDWAHTGPRLAAVDTVAIHPEPPEGLSAFRIR